jgi:hypothetical protein
VLQQQVSSIPLERQALVLYALAEPLDDRRCLGEDLLGAPAEAVERLIGRR